MHKLAAISVGAVAGVAALAAQAQAPEVDAAGPEASVETPALPSGGTDTAIGMHLKASLDPKDAFSNVSHEIRHGVVTLHGTVSTEARKKQAAMIAGDIEGVTSVQNLIEVTGKTASAAASAQEPATVDAVVAMKLEKNERLEGDTIEVEALSDHAVELKGTVRSRSERQLASAVAAETEQVDYVRNDLEVGAD